VFISRTPYIKYAEKMVKIRKKGFLNLNFEIIPKNAFSFLPKNFASLGTLGCQGWVVMPKNMKKPKSLHSNTHSPGD
jgi:hypothetical protein